MNQILEPFEMKNEEELALELIEAQYALRKTAGKDNAKSVLILVNGIELAGKGEAVKQLREWVDPRYLQVKADPAQMLSYKNTFWQNYARSIPAEGRLMVLFGNWYSDLLSTASSASKPLDDTMFENYVENMRAFEQDLKNNHVDVIKIWFDLSWKSLQKRLDEMDPSEVRWHRLHGLNWRNKKQYESLQKLRQRFTQDWIIINCEDAKVRDQMFAQVVLKALQDCPNHIKHSDAQWQLAPIPENLLKPSEEHLDKTIYKNELKYLTNKVADALRFDDRNVIILFEGMDAAGKGGAIKRIVNKLDPREYEIYTIAAPEKYELSRPYLWRFLTKSSNNEKITIFDRSWYGRVLVERIEGFANEVEWQRAYDEINRFEKDMHQSRTVIIKFWLAISKDEQAKRFRLREETPHKRFKITAEDWRNRQRWDDYLQAAADMFEKTNTTYAPWNVIATNDKKTARIEVLRAILKHLKID